MKKILDLFAFKRIKSFQKNFNVCVMHLRNISITPVHEENDVVSLRRENAHKIKIYR